MKQKRSFTDMFDEMENGDFNPQKRLKYGITISRKEDGKSKQLIINAQAINLLGAKIEKYLVNLLKKELQNFFKIKKYKNIFIIGLGNREIINDSLGVKTADKLVVSRGLNLHPQVSVFCPNVFSNTGIETTDIVKAVCDTIKPDLVMIIDAFATVSLSRLCCSFQISDEGVIAGSGRESNNKKLDRKFLNVENIISIGVPMLIYADVLLKEKKYRNKRSQECPEQGLENAGLDTFAKQSLILSPCDIRSTINLLSDIIAQALNLSIFWELKPDDIKTLVK